MPLTDEEKAKIIETEKLKREEEIKYAKEYSKKYLKKFFTIFAIIMIIFIILGVIQWVSFLGAMKNASPLNVNF